MKHIIFTAVFSLSFLNTSAIASDVSNRYCDTVQKISAAVMLNRQSGTPLQKMMEVVNLQSNKDISGILKDMVIAAYEKPRVLSQDIQERMVDDFSTKFMLDCIKKLHK